MAKGILGNTEGSLNIVWGGCVLVFWKFFFGGKGDLFGFCFVGGLGFFCLFVFLHTLETNLFHFVTPELPSPLG